MIVLLSGRMLGIKKHDQNDISNLENGQRRRVFTHVLCRLCSWELKFDQQDIQVLKQHLGKPKLVEVQKLVFSNSVRHLETSASSSSTVLTSQKKSLLPLLWW